MMLPFSEHNRKCWETGVYLRSPYMLLPILSNLLGLSYLDENFDTHPAKREYHDQYAREEVYTRWCVAILNGVAWSKLDSPAYHADKLAGVIRSQTWSIHGQDDHVFTNSTAYGNSISTGNEFGIKPTDRGKKQVEARSRRDSDERLKANSTTRPRAKSRRPSENVLSAKRVYVKQHAPDTSDESGVGEISSTPLYELARKRIRCPKILSVLAIIERDSDPRSWTIDSIQAELRIRRSSIVDATKEIKSIMQSEMRND